MTTTPLQKPVGQSGKERKNGKGKGGGKGGKKATGPRTSTSKAKHTYLGVSGEKANHFVENKIISWSIIFMLMQQNYFRWIILLVTKTRVSIKSFQISPILYTVIARIL